MGKILSWKFPRWWGFCWRNPLCRGSIPSPKVFPPCPLTPSPSTHRLMFLLMYTFLCILSYMYRNEKRKWQNLSIFAKLVLFRLLGFFVSPSLSSSQIIKFWTKQYYCTQRKAWFHCLARVNVFSPNSELVTLHPPFFFSADLNHFSSSAVSPTLSQLPIIFSLFTCFTLVSLASSLLELSIFSDTGASPSLPLIVTIVHPGSPYLPVSLSHNLPIPFSPLLWIQPLPPPPISLISGGFRIWETEARHLSGLCIQYLYPIVCVCGAGSRAGVYSGKWGCDIF